MPKRATPLTDAQIRELQPRATRYSVADGNGLVLEVMPTGSRIWRFRYSLHGVRRPLVTIGDYRLVSLRVARARAHKYAEMVAGGISPVSIARQDRGAEKRINVLRDAAELYVSTVMADKSDEYRRTTQRALDKDVLPALGGKAIGQVTADDVRKVCERIKHRGSPKMALHTRNVVKRLYEFLIAKQLATTNPAQAIEARSIATSVRRSRVLAPQEIGTMLRAIYVSSIRRPLKLALHLLALTLVRKSELIESTWDEFDLDAAIWTLPASRTRADAETQVYLPTQAVAMLRELKQVRISRKFVFPTVRGKEGPISKSTLNQAVKSLGLELEHFVLDDFRRTASRYLDEIEQRSDARGDVPVEQRRLLQKWADFVDEQIEDCAEPLSDPGRNGPEAY
jgi:integrase